MGRILSKKNFDEPVVSLLGNEAIKIPLKHTISLDEIRCGATPWMCGDALRVMTGLNEDTDT